METSADAAQRFGFGIGMAFQIIDDVLDFTGKQDAVGKPVANDLRQGLVTLPTIYYLESHPDDSNLSMILSRKEVGDEQLAHLVADIQESGAIDKSVEKAKHFVDQALDCLDELPLTSEHQALENLSKYIVDRHL
jgi:geranylgeranyl pyrophosphate synthase